MQYGTHRFVALKNRDAVNPANYDYGHFNSVTFGMKIQDLLVAAFGLAESQNLIHLYARSALTRIMSTHTYKWIKFCFYVEQPGIKKSKYSKP